VTNLGRELTGQTIEVLIAFRQNDWLPAFPDGLDDFITDEPITCLVCDQFVVQVVKPDPSIRVDRFHRMERCGTDMHRVLKWAGRRLLLCVDAMSHRPTLHEDDRMMTVLSGHCRR
jgi:hypothetical protein